LTKKNGKKQKGFIQNGIHKIKKKKVKKLGEKKENNKSAFRREKELGANAPRVDAFGVYIDLFLLYC